MKPTLQRIALLHHTGGGNLGDDATMDVVISNIRSRWPNAVITAISMNPDDTIRRHGIPSFPIRRHTWDIGYKSGRAEATEEKKSRWMRRLYASRNPVIRLPRAIWDEMGFLINSLRKLRSMDVLIVSGGGQLTERSGPWGFPYAIFIWIMMAKIARIRCVFLNVGAGPLHHPLSKMFVTRSLYAAEYVSFRDVQSQALARRIGFNGRSDVFPDSAYSLDANLPFSFRESSCQAIVGIAPMPYPFCDPREHTSNLQLTYEGYIGKMATFASSLIASSYKVELFGSDVGADPSAIEDLRTTLASCHQVSTPEYESIDSVRDLLIRMAAMDFVVTCRFHGVVFAHILNKPVLAISHHPKVANLMDALGLSEYCVDIHTFDPIRLTDTFQCLVGNAEQVKRVMATSLEKHRSRLASQYDILFSPTSGHVSMPEAITPRTSEMGSR